jgi:dTDP-glucose pyrophosphorylase
MEKMDELGIGTLVVVEDDFVVGTISDGDIRRHMLAGGSLNDVVRDSMNPNPLTKYLDTENSDLQQIMTMLGIHLIPIVDGGNRLIQIARREVVTDLKKSIIEDAFIAAGGRGERLMPLTSKIPKPLVEINGVPLLEILLRKLSAVGVKRVFISVHYKHEMITERFGDGASLNLDITYIHEKQPLGTAGALALLPGKCVSESIFICNSDVLHTIDLLQMQHQYYRDKLDILLATFTYSTVVPFGVVETTFRNRIQIREKPEIEFDAIAGVYIFNRRKLSELLDGHKVDMPQLITKAAEKNYKVGLFKFSGYWRDIGTIDSLNAARAHIANA